MSYEKFRILLWKNWTIKKRHWKGGILEFFFPVIVVVLFTWVRVEFLRDETVSEARYSENLPPSYGSCLTANSDDFKLLYSPRSPWVDSFIDNVMNPYGNYTVEGFENADVLDQQLTMQSQQVDSIYGIEFEDNLSVSRRFCQREIVYQRIKFSRACQVHQKFSVTP